MAIMYPKKTTHTNVFNGKVSPALSLEFVIQERQMKSQTPEQIAEGIKRMAEKIVTRFVDEEITKPCPSYSQWPDGHREGCTRPRGHEGAHEVAFGGSGAWWTADVHYVGRS